MTTTNLILLLLSLSLCFYLNLVPFVVMGGAVMATAGYSVYHKAITEHGLRSITPEKIAATRYERNLGGVERAIEAASESSLEPMNSSTKSKVKDSKS